MMEKVGEWVSREEIFRHTGLQFMQLNTLYQFLAMKLANSPILEMAESFLMMPDLFNYWLTGRKACEFTDTTTTHSRAPATYLTSLGTPLEDQKASTSAAAREWVDRCPGCWAECEVLPNAIYSGDLLRYR